MFNNENNINLSLFVIFLNNAFSTNFFAILNDSDFSNRFESDFKEFEDELASDNEEEQLLFKYFF